MSKHEARGANASVIEFAKHAETSRNLRIEAERLQAKYGFNLYSDYLIKHSGRPDPSHAASIGKMMGIRVRASDGTLQPTISQNERAEKANSRRALRESQIADLELSRACDAISFLAQNSCDPQKLMGRLSPLEEQIVDAAIGKAVEWLGRFAGERYRYGKNRIVEVQK